MANDLVTQRATLVSSLRNEIKDERVLVAIGSVPRERFVAAEWQSSAYLDQPLPIGHGQTTSQPRMIALMLQELRLTPEDRVLEVGTGSGYQTALLACLVRQVVSVELVPSLAESATTKLREEGYSNVTVHVARGSLGWPEGAPYDAIVVAAAASRIPQSLADQLGSGGRLAIPVGDAKSQDLMIVERTDEGLSVTRKGPCRFVPLLAPGG